MLRKLICASAGLLAFVSALLGVLGPARADYPERPVTIVVGFPPGGPSDVLARVIAGKLSELLGRPFVVDNRPGAGAGQSS